MTDPDIKALLGKAMEDEPPLGIDRDEVFRRGHRKLRNRRFLEAGGVAAGVVVAVVGAVALSGVFSGDAERQVPPATSSRTHEAPPGPSLPVTSEPSYAPRSSVEHAADLTKALTDSGILSDIDLKAALDVPGSPAFQVESESWEYQLVADVVDIKNSDVEGALAIEIVAAPPAGAPQGCGTPPAGGQNSEWSCHEEVRDGITIAVVEEKPVKGTSEHRITVAAVREGTKVTAVSSNLSSKLRKKNLPPDGAPIVQSEQLARIVTWPGLTFR